VFVQATSLPPTLNWHFEVRNVRGLYRKHFEKWRLSMACPLHKRSLAKNTLNRFDAISPLFLMTKSASVCRLNVDVEYGLVQHSILADCEAFDVPGGIA
jgi:hypothetical protein